MGRFRGEDGHRAKKIRRWRCFPATLARSELAGLANVQCWQCFGTGMRKTRDCNCVLRSVCRIVLGKWRYLRAHQGHSRTERLSGGGRHCWGRKNEEFLADA